MPIKIAAKLRPFSHQPGICCLIPHTTWEVKIFPTKLFFRDHQSGRTEEVSIGKQKEFTVVDDLERGRIEILGKPRQLIAAGSYEFLEKIELPSSNKRLSLGCHKKQDWEQIQRRADMGEIFPFWIRLAQIIPETALPSIGTAELLKQGKLDQTFHAGFVGILCPRLQDENYLGIIPDVKIPSGVSPLGILHEGARQIERLFFYEEGEALYFLPKLPKEFHAGRFVHLTTRAGDEIDMEWSKKQLRRVVIRAKSTRTVQLHLQSHIRRFRVQKAIFHRDQPIELQAGKTLYLDRFMF
ncbi:MAG: hypothetical protein JSS30_03210 [Verrucomicrobia bacterium]|nr:hypothetical protein [Verrucomicrobiota bacterium]